MAKRIPDAEKHSVIDGVKHKRCSTCNTYVPEELFSTRSASPDGLAYSCKKCERATSAKSYQKKQQKTKSKIRYQENKAEYNDRAKARYAANKDDILQKQKAWRQTKAGRACVNDASARRRQRMIDQTPGGKDYVTEEIIERDSIEGVCICQICKKPLAEDLQDLQLDHIIPIAAGGSDTKANIRCVHKLCNITRPKDGSDLEA